MISRRFLIGYAISAIAFSAVAESIYDPVAAIIQKVFIGDAGKLLAEAMIDISKMDAELENALSVAPRSALGEPIDNQDFELQDPNAELAIGQMATHFGKARKYARNARRKLALGIEAGGGVEPLTGSALDSVERYGIKAATYLDLFKEMDSALSGIEDGLSNDDVGAKFSVSGLYRKRLIDLRTLMNGAPVEMGA